MKLFTKFLKKILPALVLFSCTCTQGMAQNAEAGVLDEMGLPLEGTYIKNSRSGTHAHTNEAGYRVSEYGWLFSGTAEFLPPEFCTPILLFSK